jgi:hypothetical protein
MGSQYFGLQHRETVFEVEEEEACVGLNWVLDRPQAIR